MDRPSDNENEHFNEHSIEKSDVGIRRFKRKDAGKVFEIAEECRLGYWSKNDYENEAGQIDGYAAVAVFNGKEVGFIVARLIMFKYKDSPKNKICNSKNVPKELAANTPSTMKPNHCQSQAHNLEIEADIHNIAVKNGFRRLGVGGKLLAAFIEHILKYDAPATLWLEVRESNRDAVRFYRANGFEIIRCRKNFYSNPPEDAVVMKAQIEPSA